ncbi:hypothetical protein [Ammoniphilus sp. CFH 90114]|uniref:hypothetical protein n=1 Tax=Ammoniphilus sp. CFH 90114 TaxID=2493665 RepID=UPI00100F1E9E|nr:hypothetical protein [Ammoniphilus sp. CFH 90114]RXT05295.1 hypothetical protein EIZ39_18145 [Ammoniphilus sp. CFH 90114]
MMTTFHEELLRSADEVMTPERLGASRMTSLSFSRSMLRKVMNQKWEIKRIQFELDEQGYGEACYSIETGNETYYFVVFSHQLSDQERSDRVIAERWDVTFALCEGPLTEEKKERLRQGLPYQEAGRGDAMDLVWSRANRSTRVFESIIQSLVQGQQPDSRFLAEAGYLLRTTAVYGNGKFGIAPYEKLKPDHPFYGAFRAQMFAVWMIRQFSFEMLDHIAKAQNPQAAQLHPDLKRFLGIGNATGLGMVPYLISHPKLIHAWIHMRETAMARVMGVKASQAEGNKLLGHIERCISYFLESPLVHLQAFTKPEVLADELKQVKQLAEKFIEKGELPWSELSEIAKESFGVETQELLNALIMELYPQLILDLEDQTTVKEDYDLIPQMRIKELRAIVREKYAWALRYDFSDKDERKYFWYRSAEKEEPRMGERGVDPGEDHEMPMGIALQVQHLNETLGEATDSEVVAKFVLRHPQHKAIIRRIQSLKDEPYAEIHGNLLAKGLLPIHLLRFKLAMFGAERFDPQSNRWVRVTLFQGAPLVEDIGEEFEDDWIFPAIPRLEVIQ